MSDDGLEKFLFTGCNSDEFNMNSQYDRLFNNQANCGILSNKEFKSNDDDAESSGFGGRRQKIKKNKQCYNDPVSFVAGGILLEGKEVKFEDTKDDKAEYVEENRSTFSNEEKRTFSFDNDEELAGLGNQPSPIHSCVGDWEKHTKGIGAKLLLEMGYQPGHGLGKKLQGITAPIEVNLRKGRGAIGAYGPELNSKSMKDGSEWVEKKTKKTKNKKISAYEWGNALKAKKTGYINKTVEEVIEESEHPEQRKREFNKVKFDKTEQQLRNFSGYCAVYGVKKPINLWEVQEDKKFTTFDMSELLYNLNHSAEISAQDNIRNTQETSYCEDHLVIKEQEFNTFGEDINDKDKSNEILEKMLIIMGSLNKELKQNNNMLNFVVNSNPAISHLSETEEVSHTDYWLNGGSDFAISTAQKLIKEKLIMWDPLQEPYFPFEELKKWKELLNLNEPSTSGFQLSDEYKTLIWHEWVPKVQEACKRWNGQDYSSMFQLIKHSTQLIPSDIINHVIVNMILPKIQSEVELWDPYTDPVQIHLWIYPWLPYLSEHFETIVYPTIRLKIGATLKAWHPSEIFAKKMIQPWINVFQQGSMATFLIKNIVPKLQVSLQTFVINPHNQELDNWNWVNAWSDILPLCIFVELLDQHFFPKWLMTLSMWIKMNPDHKQISYWYTGWKSLMPAVIIEHPTIRSRFQSALEIMSQVVEGPFMPQPPPPATIYSDLAEAVRIASQMPYGFQKMVQNADNLSK